MQQALRGQGQFHFQKGTFIVKSLGNFGRGTKAKTMSNRGHGLQSLHEIPGLKQCPLLKQLNEIGP